MCDNETVIITIISVEVRSHNMDKVQSVERTFSVIEALSHKPKGASLTELTAATDLNKTTVYRLIKSVIRLGYAAKDEESGKYFLTTKMFEVGSRAINRSDLLTISRPFLDKISDITGEAVHLVIRDGNDIVYIYKVDSGNSSIRMSSRIGLRNPMYCTSVGKAILAELPDEEVDDIWNNSDIRQRTPNTITDPIILKEQLRQIRANGYAIDNEENELGVKCIGASITDSSSNVLGAFSISVPAIRMDDKRMTELVHLVIDTKKEISLAIGNTICI